MTKEERDALKLVNKIRRYEGRKALKRLPKGEIAQDDSCPLARALNHGRVTIGLRFLKVPITARKKIAALKKARLHFVDTENVLGDNVCFDMPSAFVRFVCWFDEQATPEAEALAR